MMQRIACTRNRRYLAAFEAGALPERRSAQVAAHLERCGRCQQELADVAAAAALLRVEPPSIAELSPDFWNRLERRIQEEAPRPQRPAPALPRREPAFAVPVVGFASVAACAVVLTVLKLAPAGVVLPRALSDAISITFIFDSPNSRPQSARTLEVATASHRAPYVRGGDASASVLRTGGDPFALRVNVPTAADLLRSPIDAPARDVLPEAMAAAPRVEATPAPDERSSRRADVAVDTEVAVRPPIGELRRRASGKPADLALPDDELNPEVRPASGLVAVAAVASPTHEGETGYAAADREAEAEGLGGGPAASAFASPLEAVAQARRARSLFR